MSQPKITFLPPVKLYFQTYVGVQVRGVIRAMLNRQHSIDGPWRLQVFDDQLLCFIITSFPLNTSNFDQARAAARRILPFLLVGQRVIAPSEKHDSTHCEAAFKRAALRTNFS